MDKNTEIEKFWQWFIANNQRFLFLGQVEPEEKEKLLDELIVELHKFSDQLFFAIGGHPKDEKVELVITAEGIIEHFPKVEALVDNAPQLANWKIVKFKQAHGPGFVTEYRGKSFDPDKIIFIPLFNKELPDSVGIQVCFPDYSEDEREIYINGTFIMLDALLGEKSTALDIDYLDVISTPNNISEFDFKHISELKNHIAEIKKEN